MTPDELDALVRDAEAERERRKVKPCVRRMEVGTVGGLHIDGAEIVHVWPAPLQRINIDHATAKRQIALAFCTADWVKRVNTFGLDIPPGHPLAWQFCWLAIELTGGKHSEEFDEAARAAGWIK